MFLFYPWEIQANGHTLKEKEDVSTLWGRKCCENLRTWKKNGLENRVLNSFKYLEERGHEPLDTNGHAKAGGEKSQGLKPTKELQVPERCWETEK